MRVLNVMRLAVSRFLLLLVIGIKVFEAAVAKEFGPADAGVGTRTCVKSCPSKFGAKGSVCTESVVTVYLRPDLAIRRPLVTSLSHC